MQRDVLSHSNDQWHFGLDGFFDGRLRVMRGHVDSRRIRFEGLDRLFAHTTTRPVSGRERGGPSGCTRAFRTEGRTGSSRCWPSRPGVTPPTMLVPHAMDSLALAVACLPVR